MSSALRSSVVSSGGGPCLETTAERVRVEGQDGVGAADDLAVAEVHAVERADGDAPRARLGVGQPRWPSSARKPTMGFSAPSSRGSAMAIGPSASTSRTGPCGLAVDRPAVAARRAGVALDRRPPA